MEIKECYRLLELEVGATREAVEAAYCRLLERWHPDKTAAGGPDAVREAQGKVRAINEAYQTLSKIAPAAGSPSTPPPAGAPPATKAKPTLPAWNAEQLAAARQPASPPPPPPPPPPRPAAPPPPPAPPAATTSPMKPVPPPASRAPTPPPAGSGGKLAAVYDQLFPAGSPHRRFGPLIVAGVLVLFVVVVAKCVSKSPEQIQAAAAKRIAETTGRLVVKSNRPNTAIEAIRVPAAGETASAPRNGTDGGAAEQVLSALPPGKYAVTARSPGWPDLHQETVVEATRATELTVRFPTGSLRLDSEPNGAMVKWGETELGRTPLTIAQLPPGETSLLVQYPSWPAVSYKATITENNEAAATVHLPHGRLVVQTSPPGAAVRMGGRAVGQTPLTLETVPAGPNKVSLKAKDFPPQELMVTIEDRGDAKLTVEMGAGFPLLDPAALLRDVWVPDNPDKLSPPTEGLHGPSQPQNGVIRNLHRKRLYETWLHKSFRYAATIKAYDRESGQVELAEQKSELSKYRVLVKLGPAALADKDLPAQLAKGATFTFYGRLDAVEEARWPARTISFEFNDAEPLH